MSKYKIMSLSIVFLLTSCTLAPTVTDATVETPPVASTPEPPVVTLTPTSTATKTAPANSPPSTLPATVTPTFTPTAPPEVQIKVQCPDLLPALPVEANAIGFLVLTDGAAYGGSGFAGTYFLNLETGNRITLPEKEVSNHQYGFVVSPNQKWLAYEEDERYVISTVDGQPRWDIPREYTWLWLIGWQDNEHIWIEKRNNRDDPPDEHVRVLLDVINQEQQEFPINQYPYIYYMEGGFLLYDPTLTLATYTKYTGTEGGLSLWDIQAEQEVAFFEETTFFYEPAWSSDGQSLAVAFTLSAGTPIPAELQIHGNDIYRVDREGRATRLTYLSDYYSKSEIGRVAWSPDNRYIAFELNVEPISYPEYADIDARGPRLAVLDTHTQQVTNYCIPLGVNGSKLIWSPDSRQIIVQNQNVSNAKVYVLWIDIEAGVAAKIAEDVFPVGWMVEP